MLELKLSPHAVTAIDPGMSGAVARLEKGELRVERDFKHHKQITRAVHHLVPGSGLVVIENVHAMPGEGVCSVFSFGKSTGIAFGSVFSIHEPSPVEVTPQSWQNFFKELFGIDKKTPFKSVTREVAARVFPQQSHLFTRKSIDHNSADAALMAVYGVLNFQSLCARRVSLDDIVADLDMRKLSRQKRNQ